MRRLALFSSFLVACSDSAPPPAQIVDAGGAAADAGSSTLAQVEVLSVEIVEGLGTQAVLGDPLALILSPSGRPAVLYGAAPAGSSRREIRYAERQREDDWAVEMAVVPGAAAPMQELVALGAAVWGGQVRIVYLGGDNDGRPALQLPSDLILASRTGPGSWSEEVLVDTSNEAAGMCGPSAYCNEGNVVGSHAALAVGPGEVWATAYRDTHFGFGVDDFALSDVEVYQSRGAATLVDPERGGGLWSNLAFLPNGDLAIGYVIEVEDVGEKGIWVATGSGSFTPRQVAPEITTHRLAMAAAADGRVWIAWYDAANRDLDVAFATAPYEQWTVETVEAAGSVGLHPDLALGPDGEPRIVYGYCGGVSDRDCPGNPGPDAEVRLARRVGGTWVIDRLENGEGRGGVGFYNRLVRVSDGTWVAAFQDVRNNDVIAVRFAERTP